MRTVITLFFTLAMLLQAAAPVPRKAEELKLVEPSGNQILVSAQKGKVVVVQFLWTGCSHCQAAARVLSKMQNEFGPKLQVLGLAFNDEVLTKDAARNNAELNKFRAFANFPLGLTTRDTMMKYVGFSVMDMWGVPVIVVIDKKGMVVAQSRVSGSPELQQEGPLRTLLTRLVNEK